MDEIKLDWRWYRCFSTGKAIRCHKLHLSRRSPVFHAMFKNRMAESELGEVTIPDFSERVVEMMISFMYSGELLKGDNKEDVLQELLEISDKYEVDALKSRCESILVREIGDSNVAALWVISGMITTISIALKNLNERKSLCSTTIKLAVCSEHIWLE